MYRASTAFLQAKALVAPSDENHPAIDQVAALIEQREAELFESATIRPDTDYLMTLKLVRTTEKSGIQTK